MREWWDRRLLPLYRRVELLLLLLLLVMLLLQYPVQVGAVRVEGVAAAAAAVDAAATAAADGSSRRRFGNLAVAHLAADHAAGRVLCKVRFRFMVWSFTVKWFGDSGFC